jgi:malate dehydrogenase (oxaloacetate-decarboxylating)
MTLAPEPTDDPVFALHRGGKIETRSTVPLRDRADLSLAYTPGVARVCTAIERSPDLVWDYTAKGSTVAVVTDGTAVLGLGDIGPEAALPVMEGKALLFKEFGGVNAVPICLATTDVDEIVETVIRLAPGFGGINLEDISAPRCFEVERRLRAALDIPVFHDDQHGTAIVVLAALRNACRVVGKDLASLRVVVSGAGAAGVAVTAMLQRAGVVDIAVADRGGVLHADRAGMSAAKTSLAASTNPVRRIGSVGAVLQGADVFIGVSGPDTLSGADLVGMAPDAIVFALANPTPEVPPETALQHAAVVATGRSDFANQINNVLAFPGVFRGALEVRASDINDEMKLAASEAIAAAVPQPTAGCIVPSVFDPSVAPAVAAAVAAAARRTGVARR